jgi:hypothetical protein
MTCCPCSATVREVVATGDCGVNRIRVDEWTGERLVSGRAGEKFLESLLVKGKRYLPTTPLSHGLLFTCSTYRKN